MSEKTELIALFRKDMARITGDESPESIPVFKNRPDQFKYQNHSYLFSIWLAGLDRGRAKP